MATAFVGAKLMGVALSNAIGATLRRNPPASFTALDMTRAFLGQIHIPGRTLVSLDMLPDIVRESATAIRIAALCLAAEADKGGRGPAGRGYLNAIAAGITLLEQRRNGEVPVTEGLMLATA